MSDVISLNFHFSIVQLTPRPLKIFAFSQNMAITSRIREHSRKCREVPYSSVTNI